MITVSAMGLILPIVTALFFNNPFRRPIKSAEATPETKIHPQVHRPTTEPFATEVFLFASSPVSMIGSIHT
jgi:hypothetical protein